MLLGPEDAYGSAVALGLGQRLAKTQPVELYSDGIPYRPADRRFYCHRCTHWNRPPLRPVAVIQTQGAGGMEQLARWAEPLQRRSYEFYALVHPFSPPAVTPSQTARLLRQAEKRTGLNITGLIHCPNSGHSVEQSLAFIRRCAAQTGKPVVLHAAASAVLQQFSKLQRREFSCLSLGETFPDAAFSQQKTP